jgi:hypothetical protein
MGKTQVSIAFSELTAALAKRLDDKKENVFISPENPLIKQHRLQLLFAKETKGNNLHPFIKKAFRQQKVLLDLNHLLQEKNIAFLLLKGLALNQLLFGDELCRPSLDVDLLIAPENVYKTDEALIAVGYQRISPDFDLKESQQNIALKFFDQFLYFDPHSKINIEIHWRLFRNNSILPLSFEELWKEKQNVKMGAEVFFTISNEHYLLYLILHSFQHAWERLMWFADIYILSKKLSAEEMKKFLELTEKYAFKKQISVGFALIQEILKVDLPSEIQKLIGAEQQQKANEFLQFIPGSVTPAPDTESYPYKLKRLFVEVKYSGGFKAQLFYLYNYPLFMYQHVSLPENLDFLYPLFWPYVFVKNKIRNKN